MGSRRNKPALPAPFYENQNGNVFSLSFLILPSALHHTSQCERKNAAEKLRKAPRAKHLPYSIAKLLESSSRPTFIRGFHVVPLKGKKKILHKILVEATFVCIFYYTTLFCFCQDGQVVQKNFFLMKGNFLYLEVYSNFTF